MKRKCEQLKQNLEEGGVELEYIKKERDNFERILSLKTEEFKSLRRELEGSVREKQELIQKTKSEIKDLQNRLEENSGLLQGKDLEI